MRDGIQKLKHTRGRTILTDAGALTLHRRNVPVTAELEMSSKGALRKMPTQRLIVEPNSELVRSGMTLVDPKTFKSKFKSRDRTPGLDYGESS